MNRLYRIWLALGLIFMVPACASTDLTVPTETLVPIPVACEIEQVPATTLPQVSPTMDVFEAARVRMAQLVLQTAEITRLRAANASPCTEIKP